MGFPYEYFKSIEVYQKPVDNFKKKDFFSKLKSPNGCDEEIERKNESFYLFNIKN